MAAPQEAPNMPDAPSFSLLATGSDDGLSAREISATGI